MNETFKHRFLSVSNTPLVLTLLFLAVVCRVSELWLGYLVCLVAVLTGDSPLPDKRSGFLVFASLWTLIVVI